MFDYKKVLRECRVLLPYIAKMFALPMTSKTPTEVDGYRRELEGIGCNDDLKF